MTALLHDYMKTYHWSNLKKVRMANEINTAKVELSALPKAELALKNQNKIYLIFS